mgnify:CR=1 FL=1
MKNIYCDISATTPLSVEVAEYMHQIQMKVFGNPSSIHRFGQESKAILEKSRRQISTALNCSPGEIYFTGCGSESNNMALQALLKPGDHVISSSYEHPAILKTLDYLESNGVTVSRIKPNSNGIVTCQSVETAIKENTRLVSIMFVNNEVGTINPIEEISLYCRDNNILFHTDAVQAFGKIPIDMTEIPVDLLSLSAHKLYGPKGVGALFIRNGTGIDPILFGGGQEKNLRPGTENIPGIAAFGLAAELSQQNLSDIAHQIKNLTDQFLDILKENGLDFSQNGKNTIPGVINLTFPNVDAQTLVMSLDMAGVAVSAGSACSAGTVNVSGTLVEMGLNREAAACSIRISFGKYHTIEDIEFVAGKICDIISKRQGING